MTKKKKSNVKRHSVFRRFERRAQRLRASLLGAAVGSWPYYSLASAAATALPTPTAGQCTKTQTWAWVGGGGSSQTTRQQAAAWWWRQAKTLLESCVWLKSDCDSSNPTLWTNDKKCFKKLSTMSCDMLLVQYKIAYLMFSSEFKNRKMSP